MWQLIFVDTFSFIELTAPTPDMRHTGLKCRMQRYVAGVQVAVVVYVEYPATDLVVVTVIDVKKD